MSSPPKVIEINLKEMIARQAGLRDQLNNVLSLSQGLQQQAELIQQLAGVERRTVELDAQTLYRAMGQQVYMADSLQMYTRLALECLDALEARDGAESTAAAPNRGH